MHSSYGRYELHSKIAQGGMAEVFLAFQRDSTGFGKPVALKRLMPYLSEDPEFVQLFLAEARLTAKLSHPNVCKVFDLGEVNGSYYLALEYLPGKTLDRLARAARNAGTPLSPALIAHIAARAAEGLSHAHLAVDPRTGKSLQIVHRDVSPQNLLVTYDGQVKLLDFGIARVVDRMPGSSRGPTRGKPGYMSPEQVAGRPLDARSDVFALGVVIHELLSGRPLFRGDNAVQTKQQVLCAPIPPLGDRPGLTPALRQVVDHALRRSPDERLQSAKELAERLDAAVDGPVPRDATGDLAREMTRLFADQRAEDAARLAEGSEPTRLKVASPRAPDSPDWKPPRRRVLLSVGAALLLLGALGWALSNTPLASWTDSRSDATGSPQRAGDMPPGGAGWR
jgi:serine/threonine-protein kinase